MVLKAYESVPHMTALSVSRIVFALRFILGWRFIFHMAVFHMLIFLLDFLVCLIFCDLGKTQVYLAVSLH